MRRAPSTPPELPGYTFVRALGSGGFSDVYLYDQKLPKRRVAVKVLLTDELSTSTRSAFVAEANLMAQLSAHPYIVTIFHADVAEGDRPYFVMEYCAGPSLAESYKRQPMPVVDALRTGVRLSSAIATAHAAGILHRDIKPGNVLTNDYGWPALTDFGISSAVDEDLLPVHTGTLADAIKQSAEGSTGSTAVGMSVPWSPPEMFEDTPAPDIRSDVFSLAATLYTVLAGRTPFEVRGRPNGTLDLIGRIERGAITPIDRADLPRSLVAVLQKGMATHRDDRFATAIDFARALQRVEIELGYAPTTIDVPNLLLASPDRDDSDEADADATRVRSMPVLDAQPVAAPPAGTDADSTVVRAPVLLPAQGVDDGTIVRPRTRAPDVETEAPASDAPSPGSSDPATSASITSGSDSPGDVAESQPSRASRAVLVVAGALAAIVVVAVTLGLVVTGGGGDVQPSASQTGGGTPAIVAGVPEPVEAAPPALDGTTVVFTASNPNAEPDDGFVWRVSNLPDQPTRQSADGRVIVDGFTGQRVCVDIWVVRDGRQSPDPLQTCYPVA